MLPVLAARSRVKNSRNPYVVLRLRRSATPAQIRAAFRTLSMQHHPDRGGDPEDFKRINEAYRILSNPKTRKQYDSDGFVLKLNENSEEARQQVRQRIAQLFSTANAAYLQNLEDMHKKELSGKHLKLALAQVRAFDMLAQITEDQEGLLEQQRAELKKLRFLRKQMLKMRRQFVPKKDDGESMYDVVYKGQMDMLKQGIEQLLIDSTVSKLALRELRGYKMREDEAKRSGRVNKVKREIQAEMQAEVERMKERGTMRQGRYTFSFSPDDI